MPAHEHPPFQPWRPWIAALLLGTALTPAGVVLGWLLPRPLDALVALPLVLVDIWAAPEAKDSIASGARVGESALARVGLLVLGIALTWVFYVLVARFVLWCMVRRTAQSQEF